MPEAMEAPAAPGAMGATAARPTPRRYLPELVGPEEMAATAAPDGEVGDASGAGIENAGGTLTVHDATIADNQSKGGAAGTVGAGGQFGIWGLNSPGTFLDLKLTYDSDGNVIGYTSAPAGYTPPLGNKGIPGAPSTTVPVVVGGGIAADSGGVTLTNTLVAANTAGGSASDISGTVDTSSSRYNLIGTGGSGGLVDQSTDPADHNQVGVSDPGLGTLADNGGPTQTIALLSTSPAIAAGNAALATDLQGNTLTIDRAATRGSLPALSISGRTNSTPSRDRRSSSAPWRTRTRWACRCAWP